MTTEIFGLITSLGHLTNVAKTLVQTHSQTQREAVQIELQAAILDFQAKVTKVQKEQQELLDANQKLKNQLAEFERWDAEAARYELKELSDGILVYALKANAQPKEPAHYLCPNCFGQRRKSILQRPEAGYTNFVCPACKLNISPVKPDYSALSAPIRRERGLMY